MLGEEYRHHVFLAITGDPPFEVRPYTLGLGSVELGRSEYQELLARYCECRDEGVWPALGSKIEEIELPHYAFNTEEF